MTDFTPIGFDQVLMSVFPNAHHNEPRKEPVTLTQFLDAIESGQYARLITQVRKRRAEYKAAIGTNNEKRAKAAYQTFKEKHLEALTPAGIFDPIRQGRYLKRHTGIIIADLDDLVDPKATKEVMRRDPHVAYAFISPGGDGLKLGVRIEPQSHEAGHKAAWFAVADYFGARYGLLLDPSGKEVNRLCYVSRDPHVYRNSNASPLPLPRNEARPTKRHREGTLPGDSLNAAADAVWWRELLERHGLTYSHENANGIEYYTRAGKESGVSASVGWQPDEGNEKVWLYMFSSNAKPLSSGWHSPFDAYIRLEHGGDASAAAKALREMGYGAQQDDNGQDEASGSATVEWETPLSLPSLLPDVPKMTADMLPHGLRPWLTDIAARVQCPLVYVAIAAIVAIASLIGRKVGIYPKRHDDWLVIANLWGILIGRPGVLKTPAMVEAMRPLDRLAAQALHDHAKDQERYIIDAATHEAKLKAIKSEMGKAARKGDDELMDNLEARLARLIEDTPERPVARRYKTNDSTVEKLQDLLASNPNGLLLYRDELAGWLYALEKPGREGDREFYLECWNGSGDYTMDRIGRGTISSTGMCLSLLGSIQPGKLTEYVGGAIGGGISDDGLLQRLQLAVWPDTSGEWENVDRWPDTDAKNRAWQIFQRLASLQREHIPEPEHSLFDRDTPPAIRFDPSAQDLFDAWRAKLEIRLRSDDLHPAMESHLSKYRSLMPSLALIFHMTYHAHQVGIDDFTDGCITPVSEHAANLAIRWCDFLEQHAQRVYAADVDKDKHRAHALARRIRQGDVSDGDSVRDVYRHHWMMLNSPEDVYAALAVLERLHWVRIETQQTGGRGRDVIRINPVVTDEKFSPFSQVPGAKSAKSPTADPETDPFGTFGTWHLENGDKKITQHVTSEEEGRKSEKSFFSTGATTGTRSSAPVANERKENSPSTQVPTAKSDKSPVALGTEHRAPWLDYVDPNF